MLISVVGFPSLDTARQWGVQPARVMFPRDLPSILKQVTVLVEAGQLRPHIRRLFPMQEAAQAHALCESRHGRGRIVLHMAD
jgi:NADPH:quinone reductase-like Zn-dependent oxidoreductase